MAVTRQMRQFHHFRPELAESLDEFGEVGNAFEAAEATGDLLLREEELLHHDDIGQEEDLGHGAEEASRGPHHGASVS